MNIKLMQHLLIFMSVLFCEATLAQSVSDENLQDFVNKNQSLFENSKTEDNNLSIGKNLISQRKNVLNTHDTTKVDLNINQKKNEKNSKSILERYFHSLTNEMLDVYGASEFNQILNDNLLFFNTLGNNYQLAPGDIIQLTITGLDASNKSYQVENDGTITLENTYPINVNGLNLEQVKVLILDKVLLDDASAEVFVRLNNARLVTVQISGNVKSPRTIAVPAYTPLSRVVAYSGGISDSGSLRNISLSQIGEKTQTIDFYNFLQNPSPKTDPLIKNGARIFVPFKGPAVAVSGFVNNPGIYELSNDKSEISIKNLLNMTGASFLPSGVVLKISYFDSNGQIATRLAAKNEQLKEGEALRVDFIETRDLSISKVSGAVLKDFEIKTNTPLSIKEILKDGAVLSFDTYTSFALIVGKEVQAINIDDALEDENITLPVGSDLRLFTKEEYLRLIASDPSISIEPFASNFNESNVAEIYIGDSRIAYVPLSQKQKPYKISDVLKGGSLLNKNGFLINNNIFTSFALIDGKEIQAINIDEALEDDSITLPVGSVLRLFTKKDYLELVASDPNKSIDSMASRINDSNVAEIYLDGVRIAYIPITKDKSFYDSIKAFYTPNPRTFYDLALVDKNLAVEAFDFKSLINGNQYKKLEQGDRLFIFENKFFNVLIDPNTESYSEFNNIVDTEEADSFVGENVNLEIYKLQQELNNNKLEYLHNVEYSKKILQKSNIIKINLDGELFTILPFSEGITSSNLLDKLKNRLPQIRNEFVIVQNTNKNSSIKIKNIDYEFKIKQNEIINFISEGTYRKIIDNYHAIGKSVLVSDVKKSDAVKIYYDEKLTLLLSPNIAFSKQGIFNEIINSDDFYKLYIGFNTKQKNNNLWTLRSYDAATFFSDTQKIIPNASNVVYMFTEQYIRDKFLNSFDREDLLKDDLKKITYKNVIEDVEQDTNENAEQDQIKIMGNENIYGELMLSNNNFSEYINKSMSSKLRFISGAVLFPGTYPLADRVRLNDLIDVVGVIGTKASSNVVVTKALKEDGALIKSVPEFFELNSLMTDEIILSGEFYVDVPKAVNEAINGFVNLSGEFRVPGDYAFARTESLSEIIQRAGGLTATAYPLGAVLERKSIKAQQKASNEILASQLEASVLTLAQSDIDGVGEQIKAVLGFSQQLRNQPTNGRMTLNIMDENDFYLQDGDKLMLPKRPSHVSVIGAVQRTTVANYNKNKTYKDYISSAGGLTKMADIRKAYLLLPNGESRLLENNTVIPVGSVVVIPPKIDKLSILGLTDIVSRVMGNIATSILAINNVN